MRWFDYRWTSKWHRALHLGPMSMTWCIGGRRGFSEHGMLWVRFGLTVRSYHRLGGLWISRRRRPYIGILTPHGSRSPYP